MLLDSDIVNQLKEYLNLLESPITLKHNASDSILGLKVLELCQTIKESSLKEEIKLEKDTNLKEDTFSILNSNSNDKINFIGLPLGHEFSALIMALVQVSGRLPKFTEEQINRLKAISKDITLSIYMNCACHICPDVVQTLVSITSLNNHFKLNVINCDDFPEIAEENGVFGAPTVFFNDEMKFAGRKTVDEIISLLEN